MMWIDVNEHESILVADDGERVAAVVSVAKNVYSMTDILIKEMKMLDSNNIEAAKNETLSVLAVEWRAKVEKIRRMVKELN